MITARADLLAATTCPSSTHCLTTELESDAPANKWLKASSASAPSLNHRQSAVRDYFWSENVLANSAAGRLRVHGPSPSPGQIRH